jgi:hypothetical protein
METTKKENITTKESLGLKTGLFTALGLMLYFMVMKWLNLVQYVELRFFNILILAVGVLYALNSYRHNRHIEKISYLKGLSVGFITSLVAAAAFSFFMLIYLRYFDSGFLQMVRQDAWFGAYLNPSGASFAVFLETASSGSIFTFICMQFLKKEPYSQSYHPFERKDYKKPIVPFSGRKTILGS